MDVRYGSDGDLQQINDLYDHYIATSPCTFDLEPHSLEWRRDWFGKFARTGRYRLVVADEGGRVLGFAYTGRFRDRAAYSTSVETSVYCAHDAVGRGIGSALYEALFAAIAGEDVHRAYAGVTLPNDASIALHERFGFRRVAHFTEQGRKFGRYWDVAWLERPM